ncbi:MAG: AF1514 family protein [Desulfomonile tiedjei]|uniref:AF1514 family protein n=1 Tax=Desulfomonile tiedjei TaxID=2358 RepID=A0A9D6Z3J6_9BACT|nr:AF1514 family protein [Desulfomonile tiedjei]
MPVIDVRRVTREMLTEPIEVHVEGFSLDLNSARSIADQKASQCSKNPVLLAWFEKRTGRHSPNIAYGCQEKPSWLIYAQFRGGSISVDINDQEYVFVYRPGEFTSYLFV